MNEPADRNNTSGQGAAVSLETSSPSLQGERVAFTGILASMTHREACQLVMQHGGTPTQHVSRQTTLLVVGEEGWPLDDDGKPSVKLRQVTAWRRQGLPVWVLNETDWLHLIGLDERRQEVHRLYTPAMLSQLLGIPVTLIRRWERLKLIQPVRKVCRLPYFDFQEVAGVRRLSQLMEAGVAVRRIERSLSKLPSVVGDVDRPLAQLEILAEGPRVVYRDKRGLVEPGSGQRVFDFGSPPSRSDEQVSIPEPPTDSGEVESPETLPHGLRSCLGEEEEESPVVAFPDAGAGQTDWGFQEWFDQGCQLLEENETGAAAEAFRLCLMELPGDPPTNFHLAEALYLDGNTSAALERYYAAVESDHSYLEAWNQIGCIHVELGNLEQALDAFEITLKTHPDYPDAHFHKAQVLDELRRPHEALKSWRTYLQYDTRGPWAETARQRIVTIESGE